MNSLKFGSLFILLIFFLISSCESGNFSKTPINQFEGTWELKGRDIFNKIQVKISIDENDKVFGEVVKLNDNKYVQLFLSKGDPWITSITRNSNYEFKLSEKKIAAPLFAQYENSTTKTWNVVFKNKNCFGISEGKSPDKSSIEYCRVDKR
ncbi:MAG: hypothetical protein WED10_03530 [Brumimicrobium sp.]